jgi:HTH-type transcriptional regulator/antitoxin HigA
MIVNERQYQFTKERAEGFKRALALLSAPDNELKKKDPFIWQFNVEGVQSLLSDFTEQMQEYEALINRDECEPIIFEIDSFERSQSGFRN